jgi:hypothetical protein
MSRARKSVREADISRYRLFAEQCSQIMSYQTLEGLVVFQLEIDLTLNHLLKMMIIYLILKLLFIFFDNKISFHPSFMRKIHSFFII